MGDLEEGAARTEASNVNEIDPDGEIRIKTIANEPGFGSTGPGSWQSSINHKRCCIYRVPNRLRRVNPEAYTPQMLLIGPLHHSKKAEAAALATVNLLSEDLVKINLRYLDYLNMERQKRIYLEDFAKRAGMIDTIEQFKKTIKEKEKIIRKSYSESTDWIESGEFVDMILHDSVFILEFFIRLCKKGSSIQKTRDILLNEPYLQATIREDLMLLENQLPYFIMHEMFEPVIKNLLPEETFRSLVLKWFEIEGKIKETTKFRHFLDLIRLVRVETLPPEQIKRSKENKTVKHLYNADKLDSAGVKFEALENELSLDVKFENGSLKLPSFSAEDNTEMVLRNMMAYEQCHFPFTSYICNYIMILDLLIDTDKDVDLLLENGVIKNWMGHQGSVADMVNSLCLGVVEVSSYYFKVAESLNAHYNNPLNRSCAKLRRVYFTDLWTGTATVAATVLLFLTLIQTVASVIQVLQNENNNAPPLPPPSFP